MELYEKETITCEEMKQLEKMAASKGLSTYEMMENAGTEAAKIILGKCPEAIRNPRAVVFCGKGNNGGDGLVVARKLNEAGWATVVVLVEGNPATEDAKKNYDLNKDKLEILDRREVPASGGFDIVVDAIYGTGFHGELREAGKAAVEAINKMGYQKAIVFAMDIPSGISGDDNGRDEPKNCVTADYTITFHSKKPVHDNPRMTDLIGNVIVVNIGIKEILKEK